jgi:hypothetical protein
VFEGLVVEDFDVDILAGIPFIEINDVSVRPPKRKITIGGKYVYSYGSAPSNDPSTTHYMQRPPEPPDILLEIMTPPCAQLPYS